jgi:hypothetical protein
MLDTDAVATTLTKLGAARHAETPRSGKHFCALAQVSVVRLSVAVRENDQGEVSDDERAKGDRHDPPNLAHVAV